MTLQELQLCLYAVFLQCKEHVFRVAALERKAYQSGCGADPQSFDSEYERLEESMNWELISREVEQAKAAPRGLSAGKLVVDATKYMSDVLVEATPSAKMLSEYFSQCGRHFMKLEKLRGRHLQALFELYKICPKAALLLLNAVRSDEHYSEAFTKVRQDNRDLVRLQTDLLWSVDQPEVYEFTQKRFSRLEGEDSLREVLEAIDSRNMASFLRGFVFSDPMIFEGVGDCLRRFMQDSRYLNCSQILFKHITAAAKDVLEARLQKENRKLSRMLCEKLRAEAPHVVIPEETENIDVDIDALVRCVPLEGRSPCLYLSKNQDARFGRESLWAERFRNSTMAVMKSRLGIRSTKDMPDSLMLDVMFGRQTEKELVYMSGEGRRTELEGFAAAFAAAFEAISDTTEKEQCELTDKILNFMRFLSVAEGNEDRIVELQKRIQQSGEATLVAGIVVINFIEYFACFFGALQAIDPLLRLLNSRKEQEEEREEGEPGGYYGKFIDIFLPRCQCLQDKLRQDMLEFVAKLPAEILAVIQPLWQQYESDEIYSPALALGCV